MKEKINLNVFNEYKQQLENLNKLMDQNDSNKKEIIDQYLEVQYKLLSYDLSDIPFASWENVKLISEPDFSQTNANIDFNILDFNGKGNFKNCNIKNLDKFKGVLSEDNFDESIIKTNPQLFLSDNFDYQFKEKYYNHNLTIYDLINLNTNQLDELEKKNILDHFDSRATSKSLMMILGLKKTVELYNYSQDDFSIAQYFLNENSYHNIFYSNYGMTLQTLLENVKKAKVNEIKQLCYAYARDNILHAKYMPFTVDGYPKKFIDENDDIFLVKASIPDEVRNKYYMRTLTIDDVIKNIDVFSNVYIENFMEYSQIRDFAQKLGDGGLQYILKNHKDVFDHIRAENEFYQVNHNFDESHNIEEKFTKTIKKYFLNVYGISGLEEHYDASGKKIYRLPEWMSSLNLKVVEEYQNIEELKTYNSRILLLDRNQSTVLEKFSLDNLIKFDDSTKFFSQQEELNNLSILGAFLSKSNIFGLNIQHQENMTYSEFTDIMAEILELMRKNNYFAYSEGYDFIEGAFREKYSYIFMSKEAPEELKEAFYNNTIDGNALYLHKEYIPFLLDKNLINVLKGNFEVNYYISKGGQQEEKSKRINFLTYYCKLYGNENFLNLISKYGNVGCYITDANIDLATDKKGLEKQYSKAVYDFILFNPKVNYKHLLNINEFVSEHYDLFLQKEELNKIPESIRADVEKDFYEGTLKFETIKQNPELIEILKNKNLEHAFANYRINSSVFNSNNYKIYHSTEIEMIKFIGKEQFLKLCSKYGKYLENIYFDLPILIKDNKYYEKNSVNNKELDFNRLSLLIEDTIIKKCQEGKKNYEYKDAPEFLKQARPDLFLDPNAPQELQDLFYFKNNMGLSFNVIRDNIDWLQYLKGKSVSTSFLRNNSYTYYDMKKYFEIFGEEKGLKLGLQRTKTVEKMIGFQKVEIMKKWYDKTGQKFIPDFVVMENFPLEEVDKFLASGPNWSRLMKIESFSKWQEHRDAMLKLAYTFGAFDQDQIGMKKLMDLLTGIPRQYKTEDIDKLKFYEKIILEYDRICKKKPNKAPTMPSCALEYGFLKKELINDGIKFNGKSMFDDLFNGNTLKLNPQNHLKAMKYLRTILEEKNIVLSGDEAHQLFGGFTLKYDKDFREFLLNNMDEIRNNPEYTKYVSSVQKQFDAIKALNSNRTLTWNLAVSFVQSNKYTDVNIGNDKVAEISAIAGYSQDDFNKLQEIYNYGKIRTFNSIPRIENSTSKYIYEILRLDDPLALAIGTLTDCCQELGNFAELCMEHSMVDKNGRIFIIKDKQNNIVAQSWVWRNKDVLCFDNIEIPDKAFIRNNKYNPELGRKGFTDEIFQIYKQAAKELIETDQLAYKKLLDEGKISQEQYDGLRLSKITVGLGYNDIAESLKKNTKLDKGNISRPLPFKEPVELMRKLYINDSTNQYILEERKNKKEYTGETLPIYNDNYIEYTNDNFDDKMLLMLEKLELITKHNLDTQLSDYDDQKNIVSSIAKNYRLNPETTRIIMNSNFALIYDTNKNNVKIADLLYNFNVDNGKQKMNITEDVLLQIKIALDQITKNKIIDTSNLTNEQLKIYNKVVSLNEEIDIKKGISHGK